MARYLVPCVPNGRARWSQTTALDGRDYGFAFDWSQRTGLWSLRLSDGTGGVIRTGLALTCDRRLLRSVVDVRRPPGELYVVDATGRRDLDPGFADLGSRFVLLYLDAAELGR